MDFFPIDNLDNVESWKAGDGAANMPTPGSYVFEITDAVIGKSKSSGNQQLELSNKVVSEGDQLDKEIKQWFVLTPKAIGKLKGFMERQGIPFEKNGFAPASFVGIQWPGEVYEDTYTTTDTMGQSVSKTGRKVRELKQEVELQEAPAPTPAPVKAAKATPAVAAPLATRKAPTVNGRVAPAR